MKISQNDFVTSALTLDGLNLLEELHRWFENRKQFYQFQIEKIAFADMQAWKLQQSERGLQIEHASGRFFQIAGIHVEHENAGQKISWDQPIILQNEIGVLGFLAKKIDGILHFLVQAKMEPGNIDYIQISPTVQATRSNILQVHQGRKPKFIDYFLNVSPQNILLDSLQSEQGSRFLRKRNRNMIVFTEDDVPSDDDFLWLTLGQLHSLLKKNNVVNMDSRTVLGCIPFYRETDDNVSSDSLCVSVQEKNDLSSSIVKTLQKPLDRERYADEMRWLSQHKFISETKIEFIGLDHMKDWVLTDNAIYHQDCKKFSVLACSVKAACREVPGWDQPFMKSEEAGLMASPIRIRSDQTLEILVQAKFEPGVADDLEIGPAVQCFPNDYSKDQLPFLTEQIIDGKLGTVVLDTMQSEEGGRFFREQNRNLFTLVTEDSIPDLPETHRWIPFHHLKFMMNHTRVLNVELRCLLASLLSFVGRKQ